MIRSRHVTAAVDSPHSRNKEADQETDQETVDGWSIGARGLSARAPVLDLCANDFGRNGTDPWVDRDANENEGSCAHGGLQLAGFVRPG